MRRIVRLSTVVTRFPFATAKRSLLWAVIALALGAIECGGTTGGHLIQVPFEVGGIARDATQPFTFVTEQGWTVTLTATQVVLGPLYFNIDPPSTALFRTGVVIAQVTQQFVVDMLDPTLAVVAGGVDGETGTAISVEIGFFTAANGYNDTIGLSPPLADDGQQGTAYLAGQASKGGVVLQFAGRVQVTDALVTGITPIDQIARVAGANCNLAFTETAAPLELRVNPSHWFDEADFCNLVPAARPGAADGGGSDPTDAGAADAGIPDSGSGGSMPAGVPCAPAAGTIYAWSDTNPFNSAVLGGMKGSVGVYQFNLGP